MHRDEPSHQGHRPEMSATQYATIGLSWGSKHQTHRDLPQHDQERDGRDPDPGEASAAHVAAAHREPRVRKRHEECQISEPEVRPHSAQIRRLRSARSPQQVGHGNSRPDERYRAPSAQRRLQITAHGPVTAHFLAGERSR